MPSDPLHNQALGPTELSVAEGNLHGVIAQEVLVEKLMMLRASCWKEQDYSPESDGAGAQPRSRGGGIVLVSTAPSSMHSRHHVVNKPQVATLTKYKQSAEGVVSLAADTSGADNQRKLIPPSSTTNSLSTALAC